MKLSASNVHAPLANVDAVLTYAAVADMEHVFSNGIMWSYNDDPTAGRLIVTVGGATVVDFDITNKGAGFIPFGDPAGTDINAEVVITLKAGGAGVKGKITALGHKLR
jgi:hypothetical protein